MVSLNDINKQADEKFGPFIVDDVPGGEVVLRHPLRMSTDERRRLLELDAALKESRDMDAAADIAESMLGLVAVGDGGKRVVAAANADVALLLHILKLYSNSAMASTTGEA